MSQGTTIDELRREFAEACNKAAIALERAGCHALFVAALELHEKTVYWLVDDAQCCVCGCTEDCACDNGCWWIEDDEMRDRCSNCAGLPVPDRDAIAAEACEKFRQLFDENYLQSNISDDGLRVIKQVLVTFRRYDNLLPS